MPFFYSYSIHIYILKYTYNLVIILGGIFMKNLIKNWLDKLAAANEKSFGKGTLSCCELSKNQKPANK